MRSASQAGRDTLACLNEHVFSPPVSRGRGDDIMPAAPAARGRRVELTRYALQREAMNLARSLTVLSRAAPNRGLFLTK